MLSKVNVITQYQILLLPDTISYHVAAVKSQWHTAACVIAADD